MKRTACIVVLKGGESPEREVSLRSGAAVAAALRARGYDAAEVEGTVEAMEAHDWTGVDLVFIALHGGWGEGGGAQSWLAKRGIPYTGSDPESSGRAMDKWTSKTAFRARRVATPPGALVLPDDALGDVRERLRALPAPWVVKPSAAGSSVGVTIGVTEDSLAGALSHAFKYSPAAIVETQIRGREVTVGILGGKALPIVELRPARAFYDYQAKYSDPGTQYVVAPPFPAVTARRIARAARGAHAALGCDGFSRVDCIVDETGRVFVLEVNTIPGMTERSLLPKAAAAAGMDYGVLCERIVRAALKRAGR